MLNEFSNQNSLFNNKRSPRCGFLFRFIFSRTIAAIIFVGYLNCRSDTHHELKLKNLLFFIFFNVYIIPGTYDSDEGACVCVFDVYINFIGCRNTQ